jgi:uncharacterized protein
VSDRSRPTQVTLEQKVAFLCRPGTYGPEVNTVACRETHMSWVFLAGDRAYKLKKPVCFSYLDFSTPARREAACRAELRLNRRLAPDVYLDVETLTASPGRSRSDPNSGLALGGGGAVIDWLVVMRRLDESGTLAHALEQRSIQTWQLDRLVTELVQFYRRCAPSPISVELHLSDWWKSVAYNRRVLLDPRFHLPAGLTTQLDGLQRRVSDATSRSIGGACARPVDC